MAKTAGWTIVRIAVQTGVIVLLASLTWYSSSVSIRGQLAEEVSVPAPTQLRVAAEADGAELVQSTLLGEIRSSDSTATVSVIEVKTLDGDRVRGLRISLENSTCSDRIYVTENLLSQFRDELRELEYTRNRYPECQARVRCEQGIARCRPSQTENQAYCPGRYHTANSDTGFVLSTPRHSFSFPSVEATRFDALVSDAILALE